MRILQLCSSFIAFMAFTAFLQAQVLVYTGSIRGNQYGAEQSQQINDSAVLVIDAAQGHSALFVYGNRTGGKFQRDAIMLNFGSTNLMNLGSSESMYVPGTLAGTQKLNTLSGVAYIPDYLPLQDRHYRLLVQGAALPSPVQIGFGSETFVVSTQLAGKVMVYSELYELIASHNTFRGQASATFRLHVPLTLEFNSSEFIEGDIEGAYFEVMEILEDAGFQPEID